MVAIVLFLFRAIYSEVGTALPLNGGAYNCLLNATSKFVASLAACLTILSYTATAVVRKSTQNDIVYLLRLFVCLFFFFASLPLSVSILFLGICRYCDGLRA
jgi:hypothetical protein